MSDELKPEDRAQVSPTPESGLAKAVRLARGTLEPDDVPSFLERFADAKSRAASIRKQKL